MAMSTDTEDFANRYEEFVEAVVRKTMRTFKLPMACKEEYRAAAYLGLVEASKRFDPTQGASLETFAYMRVRGAVLDVVRKEVEHTGLSFKSLRAIRTATLLEEDLVVELATISNQEESLKQIMTFANSGSLCLRLHNLQDAELEKIASDADLPDIIVERRDTTQHLKRVVDALPEKERLIIEEHYFNGKSFAEITQEYPELSKSWVSRLHARGLERLSLLLRNAGCKEFIG